MSFLEQSAPVIFILGPTAVGKTEMALQLAEYFHGEIINADPSLFYRGMDVGTAKPNLEDRLRVPHHLVDVTGPDQPWSLPIFLENARQAIASIHSRGRLPFIVGGSGQYLRALAQGWEVPPQAPDPRLRQALEAWAEEIGSLEIHRRLKCIDPAAAALIHPNNLRRTVRALEVIFHTGKRFSEQRQHRSLPHRILQIGLDRPRSDLHARADARVDQMLQSGFLQEVVLLLEKYPSDSPVFNAIGYRELIQYIEGKLSFDQAVTAMKMRTHQFIRRQNAWFSQADPAIHWFKVSHSVVNEIQKLISDFLSQEK